MTRQAAVALCILGVLAVPVLPASAADDTAVYAWLEHERDVLPTGATVELIAIEEPGSATIVFTVRYLPQGERATVTCLPVLDYGWNCVVTRSAFVERDEMVG